MKHYRLFEIEPDEMAIDILYKDKDVILIDINAINIVFFKFISVEHQKFIYELSLGSRIDFNSYIFYYNFNSDELVTIMKILHNFIQFKQEEHDIYDKIWFFRNRQEPPEELKKILKSKKDNISPLKHVIDVDV